MSILYRGEVPTIIASFHWIVGLLGCRVKYNSAMSAPRILMQGAGSVGGLIGGRLLAAGHDVTFVTANPKISEAINAKGLTLRDQNKEVLVQGRAYTEVADVPSAQQFDVICLAMMAQHSVQSMQASLPRCAKNAVVVTFQNGLVIDAIGDICGKDMLVPSTLAFGMSMEAPGEYRLTTDGSIILGELDGESSERTTRLQKILNDAFKTVISPNVLGVLWGKLLWNASVSAICAITSRKLGDICGDPVTQEIIIRAYREAVETALGLGVVLEKVVVDPRTLYVPLNGDDTIARQTLSSFKDKYAEVIPSTSQSLNKGKLTEIDYLNGYVADKARQIRKPAPLHERLTQLVKEIEQGKRAISRQNAEHILTDSI
ncbi:MAG: ketopantoate reductase family protein [Gammaproteobacteria bacterium]